MTEFWNNKKVLVTGGHGFIGKSVIKLLEELLLQQNIDGTAELHYPSHSEIDFSIETQVSDYFESIKPDVVIHLAGKVGGIVANRDAQGEFFYQNMMMGTLIMEYARRTGVSRLVALAAGCGYPLGLEVPYKESDFFMGLPDPNSAPYSMSKKMLIVQSKAYRNQYNFNSSILLPANLYGPNDNFDLTTSHVVPALIRKFIEAKNENKSSVEVWGTGKATREFLYVEDTTQAILDVVENYNETGPLNLGCGKETSVKELVETISRLVGFGGEIKWDTDKPDGQPRRFYDMSLFKNKLGYVPSTILEDGLRKTIEWYNANKENIK